MKVPQNGVLVFGSIFAKILNNNPSEAMEYNILGNGNSVPIMLKITSFKNFKYFVLLKAMINITLSNIHVKM